MKQDFIFNGRVYFGDTDAAGIVYHARYIYWLEASRIELLDDIKKPYTTFLEKNIGFSPVDLSIKYHQPLKFDDRFSIHTSFHSYAAASFTLYSEFKKNNQKICTASVKLACINEKDWKPMRLPVELKTIITSFL